MKPSKIIQNITTIGRESMKHYLLALYAVDVLGPKEFARITNAAEIGPVNGAEFGKKVKPQKRRELAVDIVVNLAFAYNTKWTKEIRKGAVGSLILAFDDIRWEPSIQHNVRLRHCDLAITPQFGFFHDKF